MKGGGTFPTVGRNAFRSCSRNALSRRSRLILLLATTALAVPVVVLPTATAASALAPTQYRVPGFSLGTGTDVPLSHLTNFVFLPNGRDPRHR